ncbi:YbaK family protein [Cytobacillus spongiae]|uniref:YbaK family protein n=1 Tax=Cytobacillus spongiae TaxID=2901381 RepID=UPI001F23D9C1|nr:YbaK family protein [Cytobacillus spongiae]UII56109.1 YbaK family protein [Cytobacillus spongiae]
MNVITTFYEKKREKQIKYERSMLRDLSIKALKESVQMAFGSSRLTSSLMMNTGIEEGCYDVAIEAYLLGAHFSRFGYYGESQDMVKSRCSDEYQHLVDTLYNFLLYWGDGEEGPLSEDMYYICEQYVNRWWLEGIRNGEKKHKLRLH